MKKIKINKSKRKTIELQVKRDSTVTIRVPDTMTKKEIDLILKKHDSWIKRKLEEISKRNIFLFDFRDGGQTMYFGKSYKIVSGNTNDRNKIIPVGDKFYISYTAEDIKSEFEKFYKSELFEYAFKRLNFFAKLTNIQYNNLKITSAKTRWGSCSSKGNISLSNRLCCVDKELIDYVLLHELCHVNELNHSQRFYDLLAMYMPDYKEKSEKLKKTYINF